MASDAPTGTTEQIVEATRDILGVVRGIWLLQSDPDRRPRLVTAGRLLTEAIETFRSEPPESEAYAAAVGKVREAVRMAHSAFMEHEQGRLGTLLAAVDRRLRKLQGRSW